MTMGMIVPMKIIMILATAPIPNQSMKSGMSAALGIGLVRVRIGSKNARTPRDHAMRTPRVTPTTTPRASPAAWREREKRTWRGSSPSRRRRPTFASATENGGRISGETRPSRGRPSPAARTRGREGLRPRTASARAIPPGLQDLFLHQVPDLPAQLHGQDVREQRLQDARPAERHPHDLLHGAGPRGHDDDAVGEQHGLLDAVGH